MVDVGKIIKLESDNNPAAVNEKSGARGLMQILAQGGALDDWNANFPDCKFTPDDLFNPWVNVLIGTWYLFVQLPRILRRSGVMVCDELICYSYNWGPGNVIKWWKKDGYVQNLPEETRRYWEKYKALN